MKKLIVVLIVAISVPVRAEIKPETIGTIEVLPETYPAHWIIAQDASFFHMSDGKYIILDADSDDAPSRFKGMFNGSFISQFYQAKSKPEMYAIDTFYSRGNRGERTDVLTIYSKSTLSPIGEVVIPPKRASEMPTQYNLQLIDNEQLALIFNLTPATSVSVVDLARREFLNEIPVPGCALIYPMAGRSFASICGDGTFLSIVLNEDGKPLESSRTDPFFDAMLDPLMERPAIHDGIAYFTSFQGLVYPIDLNGDTPDVGEPWSMVDGKSGNWRPGGLQSAGSDAAGSLYILMHANGGEGTHKDPGTEVWVVNTKDRSITERIELQLPAISIALTRDESPLLVATNVNMEIDVYDASTGTHLRTLGAFGQETPLLLHGAH